MYKFYIPLYYFLHEDKDLSLKKVGLINCKHLLVYMDDGSAMFSGVYFK
jgi:hypothetical protein